MTKKTKWSWKWCQEDDFQSEVTERRGQRLGRSRFEEGNNCRLKLWRKYAWGRRCNGVRGAIWMLGDELRGWPHLANGYNRMYERAKASLTLVRRNNYINDVHAYTMT